jgi:4-amino-4-deoxy-L-arabinose transferase-like glycosyltransferase
MQKPLRIAPTIVLLCLMLVGFAIRMVDLTDAPFDFHPDRQLYDGLLARGLYQQMVQPVEGRTSLASFQALKDAGGFEPPILPFLVALTYRVAGGEHLWIARIWTSLLWVLGALPLYWLARRFFSKPAALFAVAFYLFQPYGITASRSFQPDPFMVAMILWSGWALVRWGERLRWRDAILAGILCSLALLVKLPAALALICIAVAVVLARLGIKRLWKHPQVWAVAALAALGPGIYYFLWRGSGSGDYFSFWTLSFLKLFARPSFYGDWLQMLDGILGLTVLVLALIGVALARPASRRFLTAFWLGYLVHALVFPYQTITHDYYHLQIVPLAALSLAALAELVAERASQVKGWPRLALAGVLVLGAAYPLWSTARVLQYYDYRPEADGWTRMGQELPRDGSMIGLVHDYGFPLAYYGGVTVSLWPAQSDLELQALRGSGSAQSFEMEFDQRTAGFRYFLVTLSGDLDAQPELKTWLLDHYLLQSGDGFSLFDLAGSK